MKACSNRHSQPLAPAWHGPDIMRNSASARLSHSILRDATSVSASIADMHLLPCCISSCPVVERVVEYTSIEQEGQSPAGGGGGGGGQALAPLPTNWPAKGVVEFKNVQMRYRPGLPLVLRGISFRAVALDKVGRMSP